MSYELTLFDRIEIIRTINLKYDLDNNAYLSFSGGKDSTILHYLLDIALPKERQQCEIIWNPIYQEYRRLCYRLKKIEQLRLI